METKPTIESLKLAAKAHYEEQLGDAQKRLDISVSYAQAGLKSLFLVNGAAILALLTFLGNGGTLIEKGAIFWAFVWFTLGLAGSLIAYFGGYFCQSYLMQGSIIEAWNSQSFVHDMNRREDPSKSMKVANRFNVIAVLSAVSSLVLFIAGSFVALDAIT